MEAGFAPQLPLEALIAVEGGFDPVPRGRVAELSFWRLTGSRKVGEIKPFAVAPEDAVSDAREGLARLIARFDDPKTPYLPIPRPGLAPRFNDYEHLARVREWSTAGGEE